MQRNRSVPADTVLPHVTYKNLPEAIRWLTNVLGFEEHYRYGDPVSGAQLRLGGAWIMVNQARGEYRTPAELGFGTQCVTVFLEDLEQHFARSRAAGVEFAEEVHETVYGELQYALRDIEGHLWLFSRHARNLDPESWGAAVTNPLE